MKRTLEIELEVADHDAYATAVAGALKAVRDNGEVVEVRCTGTTQDTLDKLNELDPRGDWLQYRGSVHPTS